MKSEQLRKVLDATPAPRPFGAAICPWPEAGPPGDGPAPALGALGAVARHKHRPKPPIGQLWAVLAALPPRPERQGRPANGGLGSGTKGPCHFAPLRCTWSALAKHLPAWQSAAGVASAISMQIALYDPQGGGEEQLRQRKFPEIPPPWGAVVPAMQHAACSTNRPSLALKSLPKKLKGSAPATLKQRLQQIPRGIVFFCRFAGICKMANNACCCPIGFQQPMRWGRCQNTRVNGPTTWGAILAIWGLSKHKLQMGQVATYELTRCRPQCCIRVSTLPLAMQHGPSPTVQHANYKTQALWALQGHQSTKGHQKQFN